jgi:hypothetical protein
MSLEDEVAATYLNIPQPDCHVIAARRDLLAIW